jgi:hypothetical protein
LANLIWKKIEERFPTTKKSSDGESEEDHMIAARDGDSGSDDDGNDDDGADDRMTVADRSTGDSNVALLSALQEAERQTPQQVQASVDPDVAEARIHV